MSFDDLIAEASNYTVELLAQQNEKIVLAESCTAGLVSASLGAIPGVSKYLCGSSVVYRDATKVEWLRLRTEMLQTSSSVSTEATNEITLGVLKRTSEADWALGITGHLGPDCPPELDGRVFVASYQRLENAIEKKCSTCHVLTSSDRLDRQRECVVYALHFLVECMERG